MSSITKELELKETRQELETHRQEHSDQQQVDVSSIIPILITLVVSALYIWSCTDLGTDSEPLCPVHGRSTRCPSICVDRHHFNSTSNQCWQRVSFDVGTLLSTWVFALHAEFDQSLDALVLVPSVARLNFQAITTTYCRKLGTFHCHSSLLVQDQALTRLVQAT